MRKEGKGDIITEIKARVGGVHLEFDRLKDGFSTQNLLNE